MKVLDVIAVVPGQPEEGTHSLQVVDGARVDVVYCGNLLRVETNAFATADMAEVRLLGGIAGNISRR
jgi:hypothetical protein